MDSNECFDNYKQNMCVCSSELKFNLRINAYVKFDYTTLTWKHLF